jgi:pilus assembly protein CpaB
MVNIAKELLNVSAVTDINEITGKHAKESIIQGEQIIKERLADEKSMILSYSIPEGMKAVSMNVNEQTAVAGLLRPGDYVDIVVSFDKETEENGQIVKVYPRITKTVFANVQVLALGQDMSVSSDKLAALPNTITLAIKNEEIDKFVYATEYGNLRMALRSVDDKNINVGQGIIRDDMTGQKGVYTQTK